MEPWAEKGSNSVNSSGYRLGEFFIDIISLSELRPPPGFHHLQGHQQAKGTLSRVPQPMGSGSYVPHLMFPPHSAVKESRILDY